MFRDAQGRTGAVAARLARGAQLAAVTAGARQPELIVVHCGRGNEVSGLFSEVAAVIGVLDHCERWAGCYRGVRVEFLDGLYHDARHGPNWWTYYFEPIDRPAAGTTHVVNSHFHDLCANRVEREMPRQRAAAIVSRHIRLAPDVRALVDEYVAAHWAGRAVVGVHYRGTDKWEDAPPVPFDHVERAVRDRMAALGGEPLVFVATDEQSFVDFMRARFAGRLRCREMFRSTDGRPIDVFNTDGNYQKGLDAVVDCALLARSHTLVRTASNLSLCATFFNAAMPDFPLNRERLARHPV
ncbi:MAG: O-fucosyltransferase family protein [Vicinamibacterales bacterium]